MPDGEGALFTVTDAGTMLKYAGDFKEGRMHGKGVLFKTNFLYPDLGIVVIGPLPVFGFISEDSIRLLAVSPKTCYILARIGSRSCLTSKVHPKDLLKFQKYLN